MDLNDVLKGQIEQELRGATLAEIRTLTDSELEVVFVKPRGHGTLRLRVYTDGRNRQWVELHHG